MEALQTKQNGGLSVELHSDEDYRSFSIVIKADPDAEYAFDKSPMDAAQEYARDFYESINATPKVTPDESSNTIEISFAGLGLDKNGDAEARKDFINERFNDVDKRANAKLDTRIKEVERLEGDIVTLKGGNDLPSVTRKHRSGW